MTEEKWVDLSLPLCTHNGDEDGVARLGDGNGPNGRGGLNSESCYLSPGSRFNHTDVELLRFYLTKKILDNPVPPNDRIRDANVYTCNPDQLFEMYGLKREEEWYFFTRRDKKSSNSRQPKRTVGDGYWKATSGDTPIQLDNWVLCKIYCRHKRGGSIENSRNNQQQQDQDEGLPIEASYDDHQQQSHYSVQADMKASTSGGSN